MTSDSPVVFVAAADRSVRDGFRRLVTSVSLAVRSVPALTTGRTNRRSQRTYGTASPLPSRRLGAARDHDAHPRLRSPRTRPPGRDRSSRGRRTGRAARRPTRSGVNRSRSGVNRCYVHEHDRTPRRDAPPTALEPMLKTGEVHRSKSASRRKTSRPRAPTQPTPSSEVGGALSLACGNRAEHHLSGPADVKRGGMG